MVSGAMVVCRACGWPPSISLDDYRARGLRRDDERIVRCPGCAQQRPHDAALTEAYLAWLEGDTDD